MKKVVFSHKFEIFKGFVGAAPKQQFPGPEGTVSNMKKWISVFTCLILVVALFAGCQKTGYTLTIQTDKTAFEQNTYTKKPGVITMTPKLTAPATSSGGNDSADVEYSWTTTSGMFNGVKNNKNAAGNQVKWSSSDYMATKVTLTAKRKSDGTVLAQTTLDISYMAGLYYIPQKKK